MKQETVNQYDDDLTIGADEYDDSYYTDADDLFDLSTTEESPISRLKSLVLSIDWEITDDVLRQFNEELIDLKGIWAGNSINLVYIQALEKISKYIYQNKANSHPNAIKLLLTLYYNLEKIVSTEDLSDAQKKEILLEDVKRFEGLKRQISQKKPIQLHHSPPQQAKARKEEASDEKLLNLKAIVLGIDWEITDQDLNDLRREVIRLEEIFANSRPKLILLQGIGTLGAYIKTKKSNSHADAFKVLHLFYESLEKVVKASMTLEQEKAILFAAVERFNEFKALLGPTISPEAIKREDDDEEDDEEYEGGDSAVLAPALSDVVEEERGFQAEEEAKSLGIANPEGVASHIDDFFDEAVPPVPADNQESAKEEVLAEKDPATEIGHAEVSPVERELALQGIDVGTDDEEEDCEPVVAALADADDDAVSEWREEKEDVAVAEASEVEQPSLSLSEAEISETADSFFKDSEQPFANGDAVERELALQGVNVESEADEDSDEVSLPMEGDEIAPALVASEGESLFSADTLETSVASGGISAEIAGTLDDLFLEDEPLPAFATLPQAETPEMKIEEEELEPSVITSSEAVSQPADAVSSGEDDLDLFFTDKDEKSTEESSAEVDALFEGLEPVAENEEEIAAADGIDQQAEHVEPRVDAEIPAADFEDLYAPAEEKISFTEEIASIAEGSSEESGESGVPSAPEEEDLSQQLFDTEETGITPQEPLPPVADDFATLFADQETASAVEISRFEEDMPAESEEALTASSVLEPASAAAIAPPAGMAEEEEVIFELADSAETAASPDAPASAENENAFDEVAKDLPPLPESAEDTGISLAAPIFVDADLAQNPLAGLTACVESLGIELNETIINGLAQEINSLRQTWYDRPLEKTFLQLLSTITNHIDQYRFEASSEAHSLLLSVSSALAMIREDDMQFNQELLLGETFKVLVWQQEMLKRQAVQKDSHLSFSAPVRTEAEEAPEMQRDLDLLLQEGDEPAIREVTPADEPLQTAVELPVSVGRESLAAELRQEIASLRMTLQKEIAELRNELKTL